MRKLKHQGKKIISSILIIALVVGLCPDMAYANEDNVWYEKGLEEKKEEVIIDDVPDVVHKEVPHGQEINKEPETLRENATVLYELEDKRTENEKHFWSAVEM